MTHAKTGSELFSRSAVGAGRPQPPLIRIRNAKDVLTQYLRKFLPEPRIWLPEYNLIAAWLEDNQRKGILMYGHCGRGKSVLGFHVLPAIFHDFTQQVLGQAYCIACYSYQELTDSLEEIKRRPFVYLDDVGVEEPGKVYGNTINAFADIVDSAERTGQLLLLSTNLTTDELHTKYGDRTFSRLRLLTTTIPFLGTEDFRK